VRAGLVALLTGLAALGLGGAAPTAAVEGTDTITTIAGNGSFASTGDGGPAVDAQVAPSGFIDEAPAGSLYAGSTFLTDEGMVRRIRPDGTIVRFAGGGGQDAFAGPTSALDASFPTLSGVAVAADGTVFVATVFPGAVFAISPTGAVTRRDGPGHDDVYFDTLRGVEVAPDGTVYVVDSARHAVFAVAPDGGLSVAIGTPGRLGQGLVYAGDPPVPVNRRLTVPRGVAVSPDGGTLYVADTNSHGVVASPVGNPGASTYITPQPFTFSNQTSFVRDVDVASDGTVYAVSRGRLSRLPGDSVVTIAGTGVDGNTGDGGPAAASQVSSNPGGLAVSPSGDRITIVSGAFVRRVGAAPPPPNTAPAVDAGPDASGDAHRPIALVGSASDDGTIAATTWSVPDGTPCAFDDVGAPATSVRCTTAGTYTATLTATDDRGASSSDTVTVTVTAAPVACTVEGALVAIDVAHGDTATLAAAGGELAVGGATAGTDGCDGIALDAVDSIAVTGTDGPETLRVDLGPGPIEPGATAEATGRPEIEVRADLGAEDDRVVVVGREGADRLTSGSLGTDLNGDKDVDLTTSGVERIGFDGLGGDDRLSAGGDRGTGRPSPVAHDLWGRGGRDVLIGGGGADDLQGEADDDQLYGSPGDDTEAGGAGADRTIAGASADGADLLDGGLGRDEVLYDRRTQPVTVAVDADPAVTTSGEEGEGDVVLGQETVTGGQGDDHLSSEAFAIVLRGGPGDDELTGSPQADGLTGGAGLDTLDGGAGDDTLDGGGDADTESGGAGDDTFRQGAAATGADTIDGGDDLDTILYTRSTPVTVLADGTAGSGATGEGDAVSGLEVFRLGSAADVFRGTDADETVSGGQGADDLDGAGGDDTLLGGGGGDRLTGGPGRDLLDGGGGTDACSNVVADDTRASCERTIA